MGLLVPECAPNGYRVYGPLQIRAVQEIRTLTKLGGGEYLAASARDLQAGGADFVLLCTNLKHKVAPAIEGALDLPLLHIADAVGRKPLPRGTPGSGFRVRAR